MRYGITIGRDSCHGIEPHGSDRPRRLYASIGTGNPQGSEIPMSETVSDILPCDTCPVMLPSDQLVSFGTLLVCPGCHHELSEKGETHER